MADVVTEVGGAPANHAAANTLPFQEAVSHLRGAGVAQEKERERDRGRDWARGFGESSERENDLLPLPGPENPPVQLLEMVTVQLPRTLLN